MTNGPPAPSAIDYTRRNWTWQPGFFSWHLPSMARGKTVCGRQLVDPSERVSIMGAPPLACRCRRCIAIMGAP